MALGFFAPITVPVGWFDETAAAVGWFDEDLLAGVSGLQGTQDTTFAGMTSEGAGTVDVAGTQDTTLEGMTSGGTATVDVVGTQDITLEGMTSGGTAAVEVQGTSDTTFDGMTSAGTAAVEVQGTGATTFDDMISAGTGTVDIAGESTTTFDGITSSGDFTVEGEEPTFTPTTNFAGGLRRPLRQQQIGVRIDGRSYLVSYQEAAEIVAKQAEADARKQRAEQTRADAKLVARMETRKLKTRLKVDQPIQLPGVDMSMIANGMHRDLSRVYSQQLIESLMRSRLEQQQADAQFAAMSAAEAERVAAEEAVAQVAAEAELLAYINLIKRQDDEEAVVAAVELLVMHGD